MTEEHSILGDLPRSRPGRRSERREPEAARKARSRSGAADRPRQAATREQATSTARSTRPAREAAAPDDAGPGLVTGAARAAGDVATAGIRVASRVAGGALRRLPRP
jgi:hypothetical protein